MTEPVFIHPIPQGAAPGVRFALTGAEAKHTQVKRMRPGEALVVTDGVGAAVSCVWVEGMVEVVECLPFPSRRPRVTVVQAIPKSDRAEAAVDLLVQAGADRIIPWSAARCISRWDGKEAKAKAKWENAARAAAKQSRRLDLPVLDDVLNDIRQLPNRIDDLDDAVILALHESASGSFAQANLDAEHIIVVIGPEGGVAPEELEALDSLGAQRVVMGREVLRAAHAGAVALGALGALTSRWNID